MSAPTYFACLAAAGECACPACDPLPVTWEQEQETLRIERDWRREIEADSNGWAPSAVEIASWDS